MSSYFFGGFSAYWNDPSGRCRNHCGCSRTDGGSREHLKATSDAAFIPNPPARCPRTRKSFMVANCGGIAVLNCSGSWVKRNGSPGRTRNPFVSQLFHCFLYVPVGVRASFVSHHLGPSHQFGTCILAGLVLFL